MQLVVCGAGGAGGGGSAGPPHDNGGLHHIAFACRYVAGCVSTLRRRRRQSTSNKRNVARKLQYDGDNRMYVPYARHEQNAEQ